MPRSDMRMPKKQDEFYGIWIKHEPGDVHVYLMPSAVVIGTNKNYQDKIEFSDMALISHKDDGLSLQYATEKGELENIGVTEETWKEAILGMLEGLKAKAIAAKAKKGSI